MEKSTNTDKDRNKVRSKPIYSFFGSLVVALGVTWLVKEPAFTESQVYVLFLLFFAIGLWVTEAIPAFAVGLFIMAYLVFALGNKYFNSAPEKIDRYVNTFSSSTIWLLLGGFFLAAAMTKTRLDKKLLKLTLKLSGAKPRSIVIALMLTTMMVSMVMSNTATTAMVVAAIMPLLNALGKTNISKGVLLGVSIAATTGGMATIIGTPPNVLAAGMLENAGFEISFLQWMLYGLPITLLLTAVSCFVLLRVFIKNAPPVSLDFLNEADSNEPDGLKVQRNIVIGVIIVTVLFWLTSSLHGITVSAISAIPLVVLTLTGVLTGKDVKTLPWDTLLLVAGGLSLGVALQHTGILEHYAGKIKTLEVSPLVYVFILAYATMIFSNIMSNTAASTVLIPLGMAILGGYEEYVAVIIGLAASTALFLPISSPANAIVYSTGFLEQKDFRTGAILIGLLGPLLAVLWVVIMKMC